jgi:hypothetical protein
MTTDGDNENGTSSDYGVLSSPLDLTSAADDIDANNEYLRSLGIEPMSDHDILIADMMLHDPQIYLPDGQTNSPEQMNALPNFLPMALRNPASPWVQSGPPLPPTDQTNLNGWTGQGVNSTWQSQSSSGVNLGDTFNPEAWAAAGIDPTLPYQRKATDAWSNNGNAYIHYNDGTLEVRQGGAANWRYNNPGNIKPGPAADQAGSIGTTGKFPNGNGPFAIFPDAQTGFNAMQNILKRSDYQDLTLGSAMENWVLGPHHTAEAALTPDMMNYKAAASNTLGVPLSTPMGSLTDQQIGILARTMNLSEGNKVGTTTNGVWNLFPNTY